MAHKIKRLILALLCICMCLPSTAVYAKTYYKTEVINHVSIGDINISLKEYELNKRGQLVPYQNDKKGITPGQLISKIAIVKNLANDCWVRIKVDFESEGEMTGVDDSMLILGDSHWIYRGGYYYYPFPLAHGESVNFLEAVQIPHDWTEAYENRRFSITITADAVQKRNFTPLFDSDDPWFGTVIEQCVHDEHLDTTAKTESEFSVTFEGGAEGLVKVGDDFFSNWAEMMPGDTWTDAVWIRNKYNKKVKIYFRTETIADDDLIDKLILTIKNGNEVIYQGPLSGTVKRILLGEFKPGEESLLSYSIYVPSELNNAYALKATKTKWIFECELENENTKKLQRVQTADNTTMISYILLILFASCILLVLNKRKAGKRYGK